MAGVIIDSQLCPFCGYHVNRAANIADRSLKPKAGDLVICLECGEPLLFKDDMSGIRKPTDAEYVEIAAHTEYQEHHRLWEIFNRGRAKRRRSDNA